MPRGIDFKHTTDQLDSKPTSDELVKPEPEHESSSSMDAQIKSENEKMLVSIAREVQGDVSSASKRMQLLAHGMKKSVGQTTKFRGPLEIGTTGFGIPVYCYLKTKTTTLPTLAKESQVSHDKDVAGKVKMDRRYTSPQHPDEEISPEQLVKAYRYGMERVPFSSADVEFFKFQTEKRLQLLGFVDKTQLHWSKCMSGTDVFVAEPGKPNAAQALAALIDGMVDTDSVAVARFVARKNAAPKILALIPHQPTAADKYYALWGQQLPYEEDVRTYEFASLKTKKHTPTAAQQALADKLVESLSVKDDKADDVGTCFNPVVRRFFHAVEQRALDANAGIPPIPGYLEASLKMDTTRQHRIADLLHGFGDAFQLREAVQKQHARKKKAFWSDVATDQDVKMEAVDAEDDVGENGGGGDDDQGSEIDLDELLDGGDVTSVGSMNPIADFETLIDLGGKSHRAKLRTAVEGMERQISTFLQGGNAAFFPKALQCLAHFRKRSVELHYASEFNEFLATLKTSIGDESTAWKALQNEGLTLLTHEDDPSVATTLAQARAFLHGEAMEVDAEAASASLLSQIEAIENEDDMFADFE
jgi:ATP-dependent DNA helicase 2 subunit 2